MKSIFYPLAMVSLIDDIWKIIIGNLSSLNRSMICTVSRQWARWSIDTTNKLTSKYRSLKFVRCDYHWVIRNKDSLSIKDSISKDSISKDSISKDSISKDSISKDSISKDRLTFDDIRDVCLSEDLEFVKFVICSLIGTHDDVIYYAISRKYNIMNLISLCIVPIAIYLIEFFAISINDISLILEMSLAASNISLVDYLEKTYSMEGRVTCLNYLSDMTIVRKMHNINLTDNTYDSIFRNACIYNSHDIIRWMISNDRIKSIEPRYVDYWRCLSDSTLVDELIKELPTAQFCWRAFTNICSTYNVSAVRDMLYRYRDIYDYDIMSARQLLDNGKISILSISRIKHIKPRDVTDDIYDEIVQYKDDIFDILSEYITKVDNKG